MASFKLLPALQHREPFPLTARHPYIPSSAPQLFFCTAPENADRAGFLTPARTACGLQISRNIRRGGWGALGKRPASKEKTQKQNEKRPWAMVFILFK